MNLCLEKKSTGTFYQTRIFAGKDSIFLQMCVFFRGVSGAIVVLHSSLSSFVASTRLIRSGVGAIDSRDQSRQVFEQYDTFEVLDKVFQSTF